MKRDDLLLAVRSWIQTAPNAAEAADWLLDRAEATGEIPKQPSLDVAVAWHPALAAFFSARFVRLADRGRKVSIWFDRWEQEQFGESGVLLPVLAEVRGRKIENRRQEREHRENQLRALIAPHAEATGLPGHVARSELGKLERRQGRYWSRSGRWTEAQTELEVARYFKLLGFAQGMRGDAGRIERIVHVSRSVAGDTHWLRPRNRIWRDLGEDILDFDSELKQQLSQLDERDAVSRALEQFGIVENLTSIKVMVSGHFALRRGDILWNWPTEATLAQLPIWLAAAHLKGSQIFLHVPIRSVVSVENETSFLDLAERHRHDHDVLFVYTEGQANRAVIMLLRMLWDAAPTAEFVHQGDLDLPGIRIYASLCERTGIAIRASNMDVETHQRFANPGIELTSAEYDDVVRELALRRLPCLDLLEQLEATRVRVEQESITGEI